MPKWYKGEVIKNRGPAEKAYHKMESIKAKGPRKIGNKYFKLVTIYSTKQRAENDAVKFRKYGPVKIQKRVEGWALWIEA